MNFFSSNYFHDRTFDIIDHATGYASNHVKSLIRVKDARSLGIHNHELISGSTILSSGINYGNNPHYSYFVNNPGYYFKNPFIIHFMSRGHLDVIIKIASHEFKNGISGEDETLKMLNFLTLEPCFSNIPNRFLLIQCLKLLPKVSVDLKLPKLANSTCSSTLFSIFNDIFCGKINLENLTIDTTQQKMELALKLEEKLNSFDFSSNFNLEEFLRSKTHMSFIKKFTASNKDIL